MLGCLALVAAVLATAWTRIARALAHRLEILDRPDSRKVHREPVAYLGGLGILLGVLGGLCLVPVFQPLFGPLYGHRLEAVILGAAAAFAIGLWDDVRGIRAVVKLLLQCLVGVAMWRMGIRIDEVPLGLEQRSALFDSSGPLGPLISLVVTVGWYAVVMNSMNLIDGLDGLAGGIAAISAASIVGVAVVLGVGPATMLGSVLAALTAGAAVGFLTQNWHPARIFLGDAGSLLLGFLLATAALTSSTKSSTMQALLVPLVALGLPIFETVFSFLRRAMKGTSPFRPDRRHLHQRLIDLGLTQSRVVSVLLLATAFLGANSILLARADSLLLLLNVAFLGAGLLLLIENLSFLERKRTNGSAGPE